MKRIGQVTSKRANSLETDNLKVSHFVQALNGRVADKSLHLLVNQIPQR